MLAASLAAPLTVPLAAQSSGAPAVRELLRPASQSELAPVLERYTTDRAVLLRRYDTEWSPERRTRLRAFYQDWQQQLAAADFGALGTEGRIDGFVSAVGSGGTLGGVSRGLKDRRDGIRIALADPFGSALYSYYTTGELKAEGSSITEGIGQGRITKNLENAPIDTAFRIPDEEALNIVFNLTREEGLCVGASSGINVAGAMRLARELGPGHTIVTMLCDSGTRYQSRLFNPGFLESKSLPVPSWLRGEKSPLPEVFAST